MIDEKIERIFKKEILSFTKIQSLQFASSSEIYYWRDSIIDFGGSFKMEKRIVFEKNK